MITPHFSLLQIPRQVARIIEGREVLFPESWGPIACEIAVTKYFRKGENSLEQLVHRVVHTLRLAGEWQGYFSNQTEAQLFENELRALMLLQYAAFNSPVWFNCGLFANYGSAGSAEAFAWDPVQKKTAECATAYVRPQLSACFIQDLKDDLLSIFDLVKNEAKLFKYGSGSGTNFSRLRARGESIDGGPESPGVISYLEIFDKAAHVMRSGGTTRRAAKMVVLDADHPEISAFIQWKAKEERKARVLMAAGFSGGFDGESFSTVSGQNSNNSVRLTEQFMRKALNGEPWDLIYRTSGKTAATVPANALFDQICQAAWECADPGIQFHDAIEKFNPVKRAGVIRASNPCSEFLFLDDSACNLASINLVKFLGKSGFDFERFQKACRVLLLAQDIIVDYASYPTPQIAENSHRYRPLGLGFANLGGLLMQMGIPYESDAASTLTAHLTAEMHFSALEMSCELSEKLGAFEGFHEDKLSTLEVVHRHLSSVESQPSDLKQRAHTIVERIGRSGLRNAQLTLIAPTGTIGLFMDCDTLGIEPDFALVKMKSLVGGPTLRMINKSVAPALRRLGYLESEILSTEKNLVESGRLIGVRQEHLAVFDTAMPSDSGRFISWQGHLNIMAAAQPFLSGGISKTVNLPKSATVGDIKQVFLAAYHMGLKAISVYRDGAKTLQPLCLDC